MRKFTEHGKATIGLFISTFGVGALMLLAMYLWPMQMNYDTTSYDPCICWDNAKPVDVSVEHFGPFKRYALHLPGHRNIADSDCIVKVYVPKGQYDETVARLKESE